MSKIGAKELTARVKLLERKLDLVMKLSQVALRVEGSPLDPSPRVARVSIDQLWANLERSGATVERVETVPAGEEANAPAGAGEVPTGPDEPIAESVTS